MEKLTLTEVQLKALALFKKNCITLQTFSDRRHTWGHNLAPLRDFTTDQMARLLYEPNSYEIEQPKVEIGDWVSHKKSAFKGIRKVALIKNGLVAVEGVDGVLFIPSNIIKATEEEIFWAELGREVGEFRKDDVRIYHIGTSIRTTILEEAQADYKNGSLKGFYPVESFKEFPKKEDSK